MSILLYMIRIYDSPPSSVLLPSSSSYQRIAGSRPRVLSPGGVFNEGLAVEDFIKFLSLMDLAIFVFKTFPHKSIFNRTSVGEFTLPQLRKLW